MDDHAPGETPAAPIVLRVERAWSECDVLPLGEAAKRLRARRVDVETWLRQIGIVAQTPFGERVVWGAVVRAMDPSGRPTAAPVESGGRKVKIPAGVVPLR